MFDYLNIKGYCEKIVSDLYNENEFKLNISTIEPPPLHYIIVILHAIHTLNDQCTNATVYSFI